MGKATNTWYTWDVTALARDWYNDQADNYGLLLRSEAESTCNQRIFESAEHTSTHEAELWVYYRASTPTPTRTPTATRTATATRTRTPTATATSESYPDLGDAPDSTNSFTKTMTAYTGVDADFPTGFPDRFTAIWAETLQQTLVHEPGLSRQCRT